MSPPVDLIEHLTPQILTICILVLELRLVRSIRTATIELRGRVGGTLATVAYRLGLAILLVQVLSSISFVFLKLLAPGSDEVRLWVFITGEGILAYTLLWASRKINSLSEE